MRLPVVEWTSFMCEHRHLLCRNLLESSAAGGCDASLATTRVHAGAWGAWRRCGRLFTGITAKRTMGLSLTGTGLVSTVLRVVDGGPWCWSHGDERQGCYFTSQRESGIPSGPLHFQVTK